MSLFLNGANAAASVAATGAISIDVQADSGLAFAAVAAASTRDVERRRNQVTHVQEFDVPALLDDLARVSTCADQACGRREAAAAIADP